MLRRRGIDVSGRRALVSLLLIVLVLGLAPAASAATVPTTATLVADENPMKPGFLPHLTATVGTTNGAALPAGTITIVRTTDSASWSGAVAPGSQTLTVWADGGYDFGDYEFVATYTSEAGGETSTATLIIQYRDLFPPMTRIHAFDWYLSSSVSATFETEPDATSECRLGDEAWTPCTSPWTRTLPDGAYRLEVISTDAVGNRAEFAAGADFKVDTTPPTGSFTIDGGSAVTTDAIVRLEVDGHDNLQPIWRVYFALRPDVNELGQLHYPASGPVFKSLQTSGHGAFDIDITAGVWGGAPEDGRKTVYVQFQSGVIGQLSPVYSRSIVLDRLAPSISRPRLTMTGSRSRSSTAGVGLAWVASDAGVGVASYELSRLTDSHVWSAPSKLTATKAKATLPRGHTYRFRVRAVDKLGHVSDWLYWRPIGLPKAP